MDEDIRLEYRTTRLFYNLGYFARRRVPLKSYFYPESSDITDIDVYGIRWDMDLTSKLVLGMCTKTKSKKHVAPANRIIWLKGLKDFLGASQTYLVMPRITPKFKTFATDNDVVPLDCERLEEMEKQLKISEWQGSYALDNFPKHMEYWSATKKEPNAKTRHHYWFLVSDFWAMSNNIRIKRSLTHVQNLLERVPLEEEYYRWLLIESIVLFSVALIGFCQELSPFSETDRAKYVKIKMIEGIGTIEDQEKILKTIRALVGSIFEEYSLEIPSGLLGDIKIPPPSYTPQLTELLVRLLDKPYFSIHVPRLLDYWLYENAIRQNTVTQDSLSSIFKLKPEEIAVLVKLSKNIVRFLDTRADQHEFLEQLLSY